jgi:hypothetical protein
MVSRCGASMMERWNGCRDMNATMDWMKLSDPMERLVRRWGRGPEYQLARLKENWVLASTDTWMARVVPEQIDAEGRLHVSVSHSSALRMELSRRGQRWQELLSAVQGVGGSRIIDVVVSDHRRGYGRR